ncbi:hypothetical protein GCM10007863_15850 [Dyella mobilis]|nr:hypothetical protein GCM10007863_15850 [Dyella mobilis]
MAISVPLSVRVSQDDFEWLNSLDIRGAVTPSDKLRAIIRRDRRQQDGIQSYELTLSWLREIIQPFVEALSEYEHRSHQRSEIIAAVVEWVPQLMALLASNSIPAEASAKRARQLENMLLQRSLAMLSALLRLGIAPENATYDSNTYDRHLPLLGTLFDNVRSARPPGE